MERVAIVFKYQVPVRLSSRSLVSILQASAMLGGSILLGFGIILVLMMFLFQFDDIDV